MHRPDVGAYMPHAGAIENGEGASAVIIFEERVVGHALSPNGVALEFDDEGVDEGKTAAVEFFRRLVTRRGFFAFLRFLRR